MNWNRLSDNFGFPNTVSQSNGRGAAFLNPVIQKFPNGQISYIHTFSPSVLNEFRAGYTLNETGDVSVATPGVPDLRFDDGTMGFGSYAGYPQTFHENIYTYSDMVSISHGKHSLKAGVDFRRNLENSEFNVARPSYYFFDPLFFAADSPYTQSAGVDPGILYRNTRLTWPVTSGTGAIWRWALTSRMTGRLRVTSPLTSEFATIFTPGTRSSTTRSLLSSSDRALRASTTFRPARARSRAPASRLGLPGCDTPAEMAQAQIAGVCGPGGFTTAKSLGKGDHNNVGPRVGFAWDMFGDGKSSLRGGFGVSYEGTLYNPLSNSRWNLPYYSFNSATSSLNGGTDTVIYGPYACNPTCAPDTTAVPTFTGPATNPNQGTGAQATGNLTGWDPSNPNTAIPDWNRLSPGNPGPLRVQLLPWPPAGNHAQAGGRG